MMNTAVKNLCIYHILDGLRIGLSHFSGPSRAALLFAEKLEDPMRIYDPQELLRGHEPKLKELYLDSDGWRRCDAVGDELEGSGLIIPEKNLELAGLISHGGRSRSIAYQMWFTEHHPDLCSPVPTERWLEHAVGLLAHDFTNEDAFYVGISRYVLREYATHAVRDYIRDELNLLFGWDVRLEIYPILDAVIGISKTLEEGCAARGSLVFVEPEAVDGISFMVTFPATERPGLKNFKHVRKLMLAVEDSNRCLISDSSEVIGIAAGELPSCQLTADYRGGYGFLSLAGKPVCSFFDGSFHSSTRRPNLVQLEEALIELEVDSSVRHGLYQIASAIVGTSRERQHGCSLAIDLGSTRVTIPGQQLGTSLNLTQQDHLELAQSLAKVDGALHIGADLCLHAFACLLDGEGVPGEDRARGARFNSALRFTARHPEIIVVVVSIDRPVSVIQGGVELTAQCEWRSFATGISTPPTLSDWLLENR